MMTGSKFWRRKVNQDREVSHEQGFVLPFVLAALIILSMLAVFLTERVITAQTLSRSDTKTVDSALDYYSVEQDLIWRALLENYGINLASFLENSDERQYLAEKPNTKWLRDGTPHLWERNYDNPGADIEIDDQFTVEIFDVRGLIDVNYTNKEYLGFVAEVFGVPSGLRDTAADELIGVITEKRESRETDDPLSGIPLFNGLNDVTDICKITGWSQSQMCTSKDSLRKTAYAGTGGLPNIMISPTKVVSILLEGETSPDPFENLFAWENAFVSKGYGDVFATVGGGYETYFIEVTHPDFPTRQFVLDVRLQPDNRPYRIHPINP